MKKLIALFIVSTFIILNLPIQAMAGDNIALGISCTIPAIPGVNAPLNEKISAEQAASEEKETRSPSAEQENQEQPQYIEELQGTQLAQGATSGLTKVIYSR